MVEVLWRGLSPPVFEEQEVTRYIGQENTAGQLGGGGLVAMTLTF